MTINAIAEHAEAILTRDVPEKHLEQGDVGTVVSVHYREDGSPAGYTLEIFSITGETLEVVNVEADAVRGAGSKDVTHARSVYEGA